MESQAIPIGAAIASAPMSAGGRRAGVGGVRACTDERRWDDSGHAPLAEAPLGKPRQGASLGGSSRARQTSLSGSSRGVNARARWVSPRRKLADAPVVEARSCSGDIGTEHEPPESLLQASGSNTREPAMLDCFRRVVF